MIAELIDPAILGFILVGVMLFAIFVGFPISFTLIFLGFVFGYFGHWKIRVDLLFKGEMPITKNLPYEWYNTPNLHMCTIQDFYNFCNNRGINIFKIISLNGQKTSKITASSLKYKNLISELGIFLLEK